MQRYGTFIYGGVSAAILVSLTLLTTPGCGESARRQPQAESGDRLRPEHTDPEAKEIREQVPARTVVPAVPMMQARDSAPSTPAVAGRALMMPGVDPHASDEVARVLMKLRHETSQAANIGELQAAFRAVQEALRSLAEQSQKHDDYPQTGTFILEKRLGCYVDAIQRKVPEAEQDLDTLIDSLKETAADSDETAIAVGTRLYFLQLLPGLPSPDKESLIDEYLRTYPGTSYAGKLVLQYGELLASHEGPEARLQWLEKQVENLTSAQASQIRRFLARTNLIGSIAELSGPRVDGSSFDLASLRGKVVFLDIWATWCGPCVGELPELKLVYDEYRDRGLEVVAFSLDDSRESVEDFLAEHDYDWTQIHLADEELRQEVADRFGVSGIPATFLIDQEGKIVAVNLRGHQQVGEAVSRLLDSAGPNAVTH